MLNIDPEKMFLDELNKMLEQNPCEACNQISTVSKSNNALEISSCCDAQHEQVSKLIDEM